MVRKRLNKELEIVSEIEKDNPAHLRLITNSIPAFVAYVDNKLCYQYVNKAYEEWFGIPENNIVGKSLSEILGKEALKRAKPHIKKVLKGEESSYEAILQSRKNEKRYIQVSYIPDIDNRNKVKGFIVLGHNITLQKNIEFELRASEERFRTLIEKSSDAIQMVNTNGEVLYSSDSIKNVLGYSPNEVLGVVVKPYIHQDDWENFEKVWNEVVKKAHSQQTLEYRVKHKNGKWVWLETTITNHLTTPTIQAIVGNFRDISKRKELERQKDEFIGIASHELKTPVTSIKAFTQVLRNRFAKMGDENSALLLSKMDSQINKLTSLISDLLDVNKIETGRLQFHIEQFDFNVLVAEIVEELQRTTERHRITTHFSRSKRVYGDRDRIGQVITNYLSNAIKYSPHSKKIIVTTSSDGGNMILSVKDYGVGISKDAQDKVFKRFYREEGKRQETFAGMGLGLYISDRIITRHGGKVWVRSRKGKGSTFYFSIPVKGKIYQEKNTLVKEEIKHE